MTPRRRYLDEHEALGQVEGDGFAVQRCWMLLVVVHHVQSFFVSAHLQERLTDTRERFSCQTPQIHVCDL